MLLHLEIAGAEPLMCIPAGFVPPGEEKAPGEAIAVSQYLK